MNAVFNTEKDRFELDAEYSIYLASTDKACENHTHSYIEIVYTFSGQATHFVDGTAYTLAKGDLLLIDGGKNHSQYPKAHCKYANIMLKPSFFDKEFEENTDILSILGLKEFSEFLPSINKDRCFIHFYPEEQKKIESLIKMTLSEQKDDKIANEQMRRSALNILLTMIFRSMSESAPLSVDNELLSYIKAHCGEKLTASMLSKRCGYTNEHFSRKFKKLAGKNFSEYLLECRLKRAADLLKTNQENVESIMLESGFSSRGEFYKKFKKEFGQTPQTFRKNQKSVLS